MFEELLAIQGFFPTSVTVAWTERSNEEHIQMTTVLKTVEQDHREW